MFAKLMGLETISPKELLQLIRDKQVSVFDFNPRQSWRNAHIPGALNIDAVTFQESNSLLTKDRFWCSIVRTPFSRQGIDGITFCRGYLTLSLGGPRHFFVVVPPHVSQGTSLGWSMREGPKGCPLEALAKVGRRPFMLNARSMALQRNQSVGSPPLRCSASYYRV